MAQVEIGMSNNEFIQVYESVHYRLKYGKVDLLIERRGMQRFKRNNFERYNKLKYKGRKRDLAEVRLEQSFY